MPILTCPMYAYVRQKHFPFLLTVKVNSHWTLCDASRHDDDQIEFVGIFAMRTHREFSWMRHDASEMKTSIFDATLCFRTIGMVSEVGQKW